MPKKFNEEEAIIRIKNQVFNINTKREDRDIEFIGFVNDKWVGNTTKLILRCNIHNTIWESTSYNNFLKPTFVGGCKKCKEESIIKTHKLSSEEALNKVEELHKSSKYNYDFTPILTTYSGFHEKVSVICPNHGPFSVVYCNLLIGEDSARCPECRKQELSSRVSNDIYGDCIQHKIQNRISEIENSFGIKYEVLGIEPNLKDSRPMRSYLILKCLEHNTVSKTTSIDNFINKTVILPCPECNFNSKFELVIRRTLYTLLNTEDVLVHPSINVYNSIEDSIKRIIPDFYIISKNMYIEFDGDQHYSLCSYYHKNYQKFVDQVNRDNCLVEYCKKNSIKLLRIPYCDRNRLEEILRAFLFENLDLTTHIEPKLLPVPMSYYGQNFTSRP